MKIFRNIRTVASLLQNYKKELRALILISLAVSLVSAVVPLLYGKLVDAAISGKGTGAIFAYLGAWFALTILIDAMEAFSAHRRMLISEQAVNEMVRSVMSHLLRLPVQFHKDEKKGRIFSRINRAAEYLDQIITRVVFGTLPDLVTVMFAVGFLLFIDWRIALMTLFLLVSFVVITLRKDRQIVRSQRKLNQGYEFVFGEMEEAIANVQTVKAYTRESFTSSRINRYFKKLLRLYAAHLDIWKNLNIWQNRISSLGFIAVFTVALLSLRGERMSVGNFVTVIGYMALVYRPFWNLTSNAHIIRRGTTAIERAMKLLARAPERYFDPNAVRLGGKIKGHFIVQDLRFAYGTEEVLKGVSFEAKPWETVALVGRSGVGKTTLTALLCRYYQPTEGKILLDGIDLQNIELRSLRKNIGIVPQEIALFNDTIRNNIKYGKLNATDAEIRRAAEAANAHEFIDSFPKKYDQIVGERGIKLSTGQKQRVAIARVVLKNSCIIILDEATAALDSHSEKLVQEALARLVKGKTTFIIAHRLSTIRNADKIIVLDEGKIVQIGTHHQLIGEQGLYKELCSLQHTFV